jgi:hypothetical protein
MMIFFKNDRCVKCGSALGFLPDVLELSTLEPLANDLWRAGAPPAGGRAYRHCANGTQFQTCNWMVPENDPNPFCTACRLNEIIPDLSIARNRLRWFKLELAKRQCIYSLLRLRLPMDGGQGQALKFRFLQDYENAPVMTGQDDGVITINIAEADDDEREHRRLTFHEPYRTLVGHFRHELGHFYWDRLIANSPHLPGYRELFGDETMDYDQTLQAYYRQGPPADWTERTVTAYASSHPWEDWAESWAHYLHILDALETAASFGLQINPGKLTNQDSQTTVPVRFGRQMEIDRLLADWVPLSCALNSINRSMGLADLYPFVIPPRVAEKLRFIHAVVNSFSPK